MEQNIKFGSFKNLCKKFISRVTCKKSEEIQNLLENREEPEKPLSNQEKELITAALKFENLDSDDICVPRSDIIFLQVNNSFAEIIQTFKKTRHSRLPVCGKDLDDILGFITIKDILNFVDKPKTFDINKAIRKCSFVPDSMNINKVLQQMKSSRVQMAIVLDEYGGTAGLVTLKDILEELVGDLEDEHEEASAMLTKRSKNTYKLDPRMPIEDLEAELGVKFEGVENDDFDTIGGLVLQIAGRVPLKGEVFNTSNGYQIKIIDSDGRRIQLLELIKIKG